MLLLYGAYGYTGQLIVELAIEKNQPLVLAGRSEEKLRRLQNPKNWSIRPFALDDPAEIDKNLEGIKVVLHAAGPFIHTARPMIDACLRNHVHYLDITGEIQIFELAARMDQVAKDAGIVLLPGAGFDVVPTDCIAAHLHTKLPDATEIKLAFSSLGGGVSRGTALTATQSLGESGAVRKDGKIIRAEVGHKTITAPFHGKPRFCMTIPWGDVSTAFHTTGIPNVETYMGIPPKSYRWVKMQRYLGWLLRMSWVRKLAQNRVKKGPAGPSKEQRAKGKSVVWGRVTNKDGLTKEARLLAPNGYSLTAMTALEIASRIQQGLVSKGFQTPARAFGPDFILEFPETEREDL